MFVAAVSGALKALDLATGIPRWATIGSRAIFSSPSLWLPSALNKRNVNCGSGASKPSSTAVRPCNAAIEMTAPNQAANGRSTIPTSPCVLVGGHDGCLTCTDAATGTKRWSVPFSLPTVPIVPVNLEPSFPHRAPDDLDPIFAAPFIFESSRCIGRDSKDEEQSVNKVGSGGDDDDNEDIDENDRDRGHGTIPVEHDERAEDWIAEDGASLAFVAAASQSGLLAVLNLNTGETLAQLQLPGQVFSSPVVLPVATSAKRALEGQSVIKESWVIFIGCRDDHLYALDFARSSSD